jgi:hypothetical protein
MGEALSFLEEGRVLPTPDAIELGNQTEIPIETYDEWIRLVAGFKHLADWHKELWEWGWSIKPGEYHRPAVIVAPRGGGKCVSKNTLIHMADGSKKTIEQVSIGDSVTCYDEEQDSYTSSTITNKWGPQIERCIRVKTKRHSIKLSMDHKVYTRKGWVSAGELRIGDEVATPISRESESFFSAIVSIKDVGDKITYDIEVSPHHNMISNGIITHNSSSCEQLLCALGARGTRKYVLYVRATQLQANASVSNIASILESGPIGNYYPLMARRQVSKFKQSKGWNRTLLRTASGFVIASFGLDSAMRGTKIDDIRPDLLLLDDLDEEHDSPKVTQKKIDTITKSILPAGAPWATALMVQNLMLRDGIFARLLNGKADFLGDRLQSGPHKAVRNLEYEIRDGLVYITGGTPIWEGQNLDVCQSQMRLWGTSSFLVESQHEVDVLSGGIFKDVEFLHIEPDQVPNISYCACWIDPAVSDGKLAHCQAIQIDAVEAVDPGSKRRPNIYRLYSWEGVDNPNNVIKRALTRADEFECDVIGVETNMGGDLWRETVLSIADEMRENDEIKNVPRYKSEKAGADTGGKSERAQRMLSSYERGQIIHVLGAHTPLERALKRFPVIPPHDLADAAYWAWKDMEDQIPRRSGTSRMMRINRAILFGNQTQKKNARDLLRSRFSGKRR